MSKEYIEREMLIDKMSKLKTGGIFTEVFKKVVLEIISNQPTADVQEVRHGEWCHIGGDEWCCSYCGHIVSTEGSWEKPTKKYCSECGAKMDKE